MITETKLIAPRLWQYPLTEEGKKEAIADAEMYANETHKAANRHISNLVVVQSTDDGGCYYGPLGVNYTSGDFRKCILVYTAIGKLEKA